MNFQDDDAPNDRAYLERINEISRRAAAMHDRKYVPISTRPPVEFRERLDYDDHQARAAGDVEPEPEEKPLPF